MAHPAPRRARRATTCGIIDPVSDRPAEPLPPDPVKYDEVRNEHARRRGLNAPYIAGGDDPDLDQELVRERPYVRILVAMVALIIFLGFFLGFVSALIGVPQA
jgi:hypothetical protein